MYKFELDKILEIRKNIEEALQYELTALEKQLNVLSDKNDQLIDQRANLTQTIENKLTHGSSSNEYTLYFDFIAKINADLENNAIQYKEIEYERDHKREELIQAVKNRKSLENLKIKKNNEYMKMLQKIETNNLDDFASSQYTRRMEP
jgi:flagellar FliJ protein